MVDGISGGWQSSRAGSACGRGVEGRAGQGRAGHGVALVQCNELESCLISVALGIKLARVTGIVKVALSVPLPPPHPSTPFYYDPAHTHTHTDLLKPLSASIICMG